jgi:hypothetical protein
MSREQTPAPGRKESNGYYHFALRSAAPSGRISARLKGVPLTVDMGLGGQDLNRMSAPSPGRDGASGDLEWLCLISDVGEQCAIGASHPGLCTKSADFRKQRGAAHVVEMGRNLIK